MRLVTILLVMGSIALSAGGVSLRAADTAPAKVVSSSTSASQAEVATEVCAAPAPSIRTIRLDPKRQAVENSREVILLNTRGYNYPRAGELVPPAAPASEGADSTQLED